MARDFTNNAANYLAMAEPDDAAGAAQAFSIHAWIRPDQVSSDHTVVSKYNGSAGALLRADSKIRLFMLDNASTGQEAIGATNLVVSTWQQVGGAWNGSSTMRVILNGAQDGTDTMGLAAAASAADWNIGRRPSGNFPFDGRIAEVAIWNVYLTDAEWLMLGRGASPLIVRRASLRGYWPIFGNGSPEPDLSGNGFNAVVNGTLNAVDHAPVGRIGR